MTKTKRKHAWWAPLALGLALFAGQAGATPITPGFDSHTLPRNDDGFAGPVSLGFTLDFFGNDYSQLYVNNNGNVTFNNGSGTYTPFGLTGSTNPIIAPFFADVDTTSAGNPVTYGPGTYNGHSAFGVNWPGVAGYGLSPDLLNNFQLVLVDRADTGLGNFDIYFNYGLISWDTGTASQGQSATAGYSNGSGIAGTYYQITGSGTPGAFLNGGPDALVNATNDNVPGQFLFEVRSGSVRQPAAAVPEPATVALFGAGLLCLAALRRRVRRIPALR